jgi:peroxiredoxin
MTLPLSSIGATLSLAAVLTLPAVAAPNQKPTAKPTAAKKPAPAKKPAAAPTVDPAAAVARLKKDEARVQSGRLSLHVVSRQGDLPPNSGTAAAWAAGKKHSVAAQTREYFVFSATGWKRDITVMDSQGNVSAHYVMAVGKEAPRILEETGHGDQAKRSGTIGVEPRQNAADRLLLCRGSDLLEDVVWKSGKKEGTILALTGTRGDERVTVRLRTTPHYAVERLLSEETVETPVGKVSRGQELIAEYAPEKGFLAPKSLQHLIYIGDPQSQVLLTAYKVEGAQLNPTLKADELRLPFSQGLTITDRRVDPPARYPQGEKDLTLAEVQALQANSVAAVGKPSPDWESKTLDGKTAKLRDYRGRVVLLTWFASWCGPCHAEAPRMENEIWRKYRDQGLTVLGVNTGERDDPMKMAGEFVKQHGLTYSILMDTEGLLSDAFQVEVLPTLAIVDRKGVLRYLQRGFREEEVIRQVEKLLAEE